MLSVFNSAMKVINDSFIELYQNDPHIISVFVVGSMAVYPYNERKYNDYDIRCVVDEFLPSSFEKVESTVEQCIKKIEKFDNIGIASSDLVGPVNHHVTNKEHNILIHYMVHSMDDLVNFLPNTHKYMYGNHYLQICGRDVIKELKLANTRYSLEDIVFGYEGIDYCVDMIKNHKHRYCRYEVVNEKCEFKSYETTADIYVKCENCFYAVLKNIGNLKNYDFFKGLAKNLSLFEYGKSMLDEVGYTDYKLLDILIRKDEGSLLKEYPEFDKDTIVLLNHLRKYILEIKKY